MKKARETNKPKKEKANGNIEEVTAAEISGTSADNKETASAEEKSFEKGTYSCTKYGRPLPESKCRV